MVIVVRSLFFAELLYCNSTIQIQPYGTLICIEKKFTKCVSRLLEITFIVSIRVPDSGGAAFKVENNDPVIFAGDDRIKFFQYGINIFDLATEIAICIYKVHTIFIDQQSRIIPEIRLAVQIRIFGV